MFADHSQEFLRFAARYGRVFSVDRLGFNALIAPNVFFVGKVVAELPLRLPRSVSPPKAEFSYIEVKDFPQGIVRKEGEVNCAALYHSYPLCLMEYFGILLSNPHVLSFIGDASQESGKPFYSNGNPAGFQHWARETKLAFWATLTGEYFPTDPARQSTAFYLMHIALRFLWFHELAHILDGHLEYVMSKLKLSEVCLHSSDGIERFHKDAELRGLELIADVVACQLLLRGLFKHDDDFMPEVIKNLPRAEQLLVTLTAIMSLCWFWFAPDASVTVELGGQANFYEWSDHPSNIARLTRIIGTFKRLLQKRTDLGDFDIDSVFTKLGIESEAMAVMDASMEFLRTVKVHDLADEIFYTPFTPPKPLFDFMTKMLRKDSYIFRFLDGTIF